MLHITLHNDREYYTYETMAKSLSERELAVIETLLCGQMEFSPEHQVVVPKGSVDKVLEALPKETARTDPSKMTNWELLSSDGWQTRGAGVAEIAVLRHRISSKRFMVVVGTGVVQY
jgi:hypothetical protein